LTRQATALFLTLLAFGLGVRAVEFGFVNFDDSAYFYQNPHVLGGLTLENFLWSFEIHGPSMWIPLTWLSHQTMVSLFGTEAGPHHLLNVLLHAANAGLLFVVLSRILSYGVSTPDDGANRIAGLAALLFVVHPTHVESYVWITERKDVLALFFSLLTMLSWLRWRSSGKRLFYGFAVAACALAVMAKPLAVTLPCVLIMLDVWPVRVVRKGSVTAALPGYLPFFGAAILASWMTVLCQKSIGAIGSAEAYPLLERVPNVLTAYGIYLKRLFWPFDLAVFYPYPAQPDWLAASLSLSVLLALLCLAWWQRRVLPQLLWGLLFFLGTLVPMIGIVQAGAAHTADRYAYLPFIGLYLALSSVVYRIFHDKVLLRRLILTGFIICLAVLHWRQVGYWRNSERLMARSAEVVPGSWLAHNNLGLAYKAQGRLLEARQAYQRSIEAKPDYVQAINNLAILDAEAGQLELARKALRRALELQPDNATSQHNLGKVLLSLGETAAAEVAFSRAVELSPDYTMALYDYAWLLLQEQRAAEAVELLQRCVRLTPDFVNGWINLGVARQQIGQLESALEAYRESADLAPHNPVAAMNYVRLARQLEQTEGLDDRLQIALRHNPENEAIRRLLEPNQQ